MALNLDDADAFLCDFATRHGIRRLALFGSVLHGEDTPASDIDLLVEFEEGRTPGLLGMAEMELELSAILGREVDLRTYEDLSRYFRDDVRAQARVLYAMPPDDEIRVCHLVEAASKAVSYAAGRSRDDLDDDELFASPSRSSSRSLAKQQSTSATTCANPIRRCRGRRLRGCGTGSSTTTSTSTGRNHTSSGSALPVPTTLLDPHSTKSGAAIRRPSIVRTAPVTAQMPIDFPHAAQVFRVIRYVGGLDGVHLAAS